MKAIWKFPLEITDEQFVEVPAHAQFLTVQMQGAQPCLWALVNKDEQDKEQRLVRIIGTGHPIEDDFNLRYLSTFQTGPLVFHVFHA